MDLFESDGGVRVVAMFPEVNEKEELDLKLEDKILRLVAKDFEEELELPFPVKPDPEVRFNNGIFDIHFERQQE